MESRTRVRSEAAGSDQASVVTGALWMVGLTLVLFFLPLVNGLIGGLVGGYKVGGAGRALVAALLPAVVASVGLWILFAIADAPVFGVAASAAAAMLIVLADVGILIGAVVGGALGSAPDERIGRLPA